MVGCASQPTEITEQSGRPAVGAIRAGTWQGSKGEAQITLSLSNAGKFQVVFKGGKYRSVVKGKAAIKGEKLVLTATDFEGRAPQTPQEKKPIEFGIGDDWQTIVSPEGMRLSRKI